MTVGTVPPRPNEDRQGKKKNGEHSDYLVAAPPKHRDGVHDHPHRLWTLVMLELWFRRFIDGVQRVQPTGAASDGVRAFTASVEAA